MNLRDIVLSVKSQWEIASTPNAKSRLEGFQRATYCVTDAFLRELGTPLETARFAKIIVELDDQIAAPDEHSVREAPPILVFRWPVDLAAYEEKTKPEKRLFILRLLHDSLEWVANVKGWNYQSLHIAFQGLQDRGVEHRGRLLSKEYLNPSRNISARILFDFDIDRLRIIGVVVDKHGNEIGRHTLVEEKPIDAPLRYYSGKVEWLTDSKFLLRSRDGSVTWPCEIGDQ